MKTITFMLSKKLIVLCLFMMSLTGFAQTNFTVFLANGSNPTTTTFEVDIMLTVVAPAAGVRLVGVTTGINFNMGIMNGGTPCTTAACGTWTALGGETPILTPLLDTNNTYRLPSGVATWGHLRTVMSNLASSSGIDIPPGTYKVGRYRFTNSVAFTDNSNANLWLNPVNNNPTGSTNTIVSFYPFGAVTPLSAYTTTAPAAGAGLTLTHTAAATFSLPLNGVSEICATSGTVVTVPETCLGANNGSATITMNPVPTNLNVTYLRDNSVSGSATLNASGQFTITGLIAGDHIITVTSASAFCTTPVSIVTGFNVGAGSNPGPPPTVACYETATLNNATCTWVVTGTQPAAPTGLACYQTATFNGTTCVWDVTGTQPAAPTGLACYQTASFNGTTCVWDVTGTQPAAPTGLACYQTASFNNTTCLWVVTGTQPAAPTVACYETATFNNTTCAWVVTGTQPAPPTLLCYQTLGTFNNTTCQWNVSGTQPTAPTTACYETATFNNTTCAWVVTGTQPAPPTLACYQTLGTFNNTTCQWNVSGTQPTAPTVACYQTATFNNTTCVWDVTGTQPVQPTTACYQTATFNNTTCAWVVTGTQPTAPTVACYQTATFNGTTCVWDVTGTQPAAPTGLACYQTASFNNTTCAWVVTGTQPVQPTTACYQTATFNNTTCAWVLTGTQPVQPTTACYQTASFNNTTCAWVLTGTQPVQPTTACYQTASFNNTTCAWVLTGTQPAAPTGLACYQTASFNNTTCAWVVTGTQPAAPTGLACYQSASFNNTTCAWVVTGTQPAAPTGLACYQTASFNNTTCAWVITGTQPAAPTGLACYQTASFNNTTCAWVVTGTQPVQPTTACYQTATFNNTTCAWVVTGTQPVQPTLLCYQTATFNNTTCAWVVTGTQPTLGSVTTTAVGSYTWPGPYGTGLTYTTNQTNLQNLVGCNLATLNLTIISSVTTVNTFTVGSSCGATITGLNVTINTPLVAGTTLYRFRLTNMATSVVQIIDRPVNSFALSNFPGITLGTQYQIEVARVVGVIPTPYGPPCVVFTPSPTSTIGSHCGTTLTSLSQYIYSTYVPSATGYRFRITNQTTPAETTTISSGLNRFALTDGLLLIRYATPYLVEVALRNTDGTYLPYSIGCIVTTPAFPTTTIKPIQCGLTTPTSYTTYLEAVIVAGATEYRFRVSSVAPAYSATVTKFTNKVTLSEFAGLLPGTTYTVDVSLKIGGIFGPYGATCSVTTPGLVKTMQTVSNEFTAIAYPNPFASDFMFNVKTSSESTIQIRVYDMLGKQIDNRNVEVLDIENLQVGSNYPSGVYNVIVSQGENTQTLRVIKR